MKSSLNDVGTRKIAKESHRNLSKCCTFLIAIVNNMRANSKELLYRELMQHLKETEKNALLTRSFTISSLLNEIVFVLDLAQNGFVSLNESAITSLLTGIECASDALQIHALEKPQEFYQILIDGIKSIPRTAKKEKITPIKIQRLEEILTNGLLSKHHPYYV